MLALICVVTAFQVFRKVSSITSLSLLCGRQRQFNFALKCKVTSFQDGFYTSDNIDSS